jgi:TonB family protein
MIASAARIAISGLAAACLFAQPAHAAELALAPSSDWALREYDDKCRVIRMFGTGEDAVTLWLDQGSLTPSFNVTLLGRPLRNPYGPNISVRFAPEPEYSRNYLYAESSKGRPVVTLFGVRLTPNAAERALLGLPPEDAQPASAIAIAPRSDPAAIVIAQATAITDIRFGRALAQPLRLETSALDAPLAMLQACAERLERQIGVNTALATSGPRPVDQARWAAEVQKGYPAYLARAEEEAKVDVRLTITTTGKPTFCEVVDVDGLTSFNDTACLLLLKHAMFEPARNSKGEPVVARYRTRITFKLN